MSALALASACSVDTAKKHYVLAEKLWTDGKYAASVVEFEKVTLKDPKGKLGLQALYRAASTQTLFLSEYNEAIRKFRTYTQLSRDPVTTWDAQKQIGEILYAKTEQYDQAVQHYQQLIKQNPKAPEVPEFAYRIGRSQFFLSQFDEAIRTFQDISKKHPKSRWSEKAKYEIGVTYFTRGERGTLSSERSNTNAYQKAIQAFDAFLREHPGSEWVSQAKFGIASCLEELDQLDAAYQAFEELKATYPSPNVILIKLARIRERRTQRSR